MKRKSENEKRRPPGNAARCTMDAFVRWHGRHDHAETVFGSEDRVLRPHMGRPGHSGDAALSDSLGGTSSVWITLFRSARRWTIDDEPLCRIDARNPSAGCASRSKSATSLILKRRFAGIRERCGRHRRRNRLALPCRPAHPWCAVASHAPRRTTQTESLDISTVRRLQIQILINYLNRADSNGRQVCRDRSRPKTSHIPPGAV